VIISLTTRKHCTSRS